MTANQNNLKNTKRVLRTGGKDTLVEQARRHGIFVLECDQYIEFLDEFTGKRLGLWQERPFRRFVINDVWRSGNPRDCLMAIVSPNAL